MNDGPDWNTIKNWPKSQSNTYIVYYDPQGTGHWAWHKEKQYWHWTSTERVNQTKRWEQGAKNWQNWQKKKGNRGGAHSEPMNWNQFQSHHKGKNLSKETVQDLWRQYKASF